MTLPTPASNSTAPFQARAARSRPVTLIGMGEDGCASLTSRAMGAIARAQVLVGGERHLAFFPDFPGQRVVLKGSPGKILARLREQLAEDTIAILASGDPLFFGIGALAMAELGANNVEVLPHSSSIQLAFSRVGMSWEDARLVSVHGRPMSGLAVRLRRARKAAVLTDPERGPARVAEHLLKFGQLDWQTWVCERLGGPGERVRPFSLEELAAEPEFDPLSVVVLARPPGSALPPVVGYLPEASFAKRMPKVGLITKREVRLLALGELALRETSVVWDVGAGSGSVAIEAALLCPEGRAYAVEVDPEGAALCRENALSHGADNVMVVEGRAPGALDALETPDAVFVGGSKGDLRAIVACAHARLRPGGKLVVSAITLENIGEAASALKDEGLDAQVTLVQASRSVPLAHYRRLEGQNPIFLFSAQKPVASSAASDVGCADTP